MLLYIIGFLMFLTNTVDTARFLTERKNPDGGYSFARFGPSTASATYYAVSSFNMLNIEPPDKEKTVAWCLSKQSEDGSFPSIQIAFYVTSTLEILNLGVKNPSGFLRWCYQHYKNGLFSEKNNGVPSLKATYMITSTMAHYEENRYKKEITNNLSNHLPDNLTDIFRYVRIFENIGSSVPNQCKIIDFIKRCKTPPGFYSLVPETTSFLEHTYHAIYLSKKFDVPVEQKRLREYILSCRNRDGGFGRAPSAASFVQYMYYALKSLQLLK